MIRQWLATYAPQTVQESEAALREIMQEVALAGLHRANFFKVAAFYGDSALRIFHGLDRFSEDLDFSLLQKQADFDFSQYFESMLDEFAARGMQVRIRQKKKSGWSILNKPKLMWLVLFQSLRC